MIARPPKTARRLKIERSQRVSLERMPILNWFVDAAFGSVLSRLADGRRVHKTARGPELVKPARNFQCGLVADSVSIDFGVVADLLDRLVGPVAGYAEAAGRSRVLAKKILNLWATIL